VAGGADVQPVDTESCVSSAGGRPRCRVHRGESAIRMSRVLAVLAIGADVVSSVAVRAATAVAAPTRSVPTHDRSTCEETVPPIRGSSCTN
jgi:hypothetical protein